MPTDPQIRSLARQLVGVEQRLKHLETVPQLAHSSIDDRGLPVFDAEGQLVSMVGKQSDGTWGAPPLAGPVPSAPKGIAAAGGAGIIHVRWAGAFEEGSQAPLDFDALEVLIDGELAGAIPDRDGGSLTIEASPGTRFVTARVRTLVPRHSSSTTPFSVLVREPAELLFDDVAGRAEALEAELQSARGDLAAAVAELEGVMQIVTTQGPPPSDPVVGHTIWVAPNGRMFRAVECESGGA